MQYTTYLFDFDYTLADSSTGIVKCFRIILTRYGYMLPTDEDIKRTIGKTLESSFSTLTGVVHEDTLFKFRKEYEHEANTHMTINTQLYPETIQVLSQLKKRGCKLGIISTKYRYRIQELVESEFPENFFDVIVGGEDVKLHKPSPEGILKALDSLNADKHHTLYIGDNEVDAQAAQDANVDFAGILYGMTNRKDLASYPHRSIMTTLSELLTISPS